MAGDEKGALDEAVRLKIEQRAYEIWQSEGGPHGYDTDHWLRAEAELMSSPAFTTPSPNVESQSAPAKGEGDK